MSKWQQCILEVIGVKSKRFKEKKMNLLNRSIKFFNQYGYYLVINHIYS